jgi:transposase
MRYIGLDVHKRVVQAHIADQAGAKLGACRFELSASTLNRFAQRHLGPDTAVALEATTNTWAVVDVLTPYCDRIVVSNPLRTKAIASAKIKTDKVDAEVLAHLLRLDYLPTVWQPDAPTREARALASRRGALTRQSITLKNRIQSVLHQKLIASPARLFGKSGRAWLATVELPTLARAEVDTLLHLLDTLAVEQQALQAQIDASAVASEDMQLLMTLPGVDVVVAQGLVAAIGPIERFTSAASLTAYLGLVPSVRQSAAHAYYGKITKRGNTNARWLLVQAAHVAARHPGPLGAQFRRLNRRKSYCVAIVALARKLAVLCWHLLSHREPYRYALPATVEAKFARLRGTQQNRRPVGPKKGTVRPAQYGSGVRTRKRQSLDEVLSREGLPVTQTPPPAETRVVKELGLFDFTRRIQRSDRIQQPVRG